MDCVPGGSLENLEYTATRTVYDSTVTDSQRTILNDAQTSGGLLIALAADEAHEYVSKMQAKGLTAEIIGEFSSGGQPGIRVF
jgi:selenide,water dikinase